MGATSQARVMTAEWTPKTLSALSASPLSGSRRNRPTQQKHKHPAESLCWIPNCHFLHSTVKLNSNRFNLPQKKLQTKINLTSNEHTVTRFQIYKKDLKLIVYTIHDCPCDAHFIIQKSNSVSSCLPPEEPVNCLVLSHRMPIYCTCKRKWCGPGPSQAILSPLLGLKQNWKITPLALTVHLNHFNTIIIMRLSNIIFKSLAEKKKEFHFLCLTILNWERASEWRRKWYLMRQAKKVIKSHL